jgi:hypothetical protein
MCEVNEHTGMAKRQPWLLRSDGKCYCRACVYPRYLHFAEPAVQSDSMSAQSAHQVHAHRHAIQPEMCFDEESNPWVASD